MPRKKVENVEEIVGIVEEQEQQQVTSLVVKTELKTAPIIEYNREEIQSFINYVLNKTENIVVAKENQKEYAEMCTNINAVISNMEKSRKGLEKEIKKPIEEFTEDFKGWEKLLKERYREIKEQIDYYTQQELQEQLNEMSEIKKELCEELGIEKELIRFIPLPKQEKELSRSSYTTKKARELIQQEIENAKMRYQTIKDRVEIINIKNSVSLDSKEYVCYVNDISKAIERIEYDCNTVLKFRERQKQLEQEKQKIQEIQEMQEKQHVDDTSKNNPTKTTPDTVSILITFNKTDNNDKEKAKELVTFLEAFNIKFEVVK